MASSMSFHDCIAYLWSDPKCAEMGTSRDMYSFSFVAALSYLRQRHATRLYDKRYVPGGAYFPVLLMPKSTIDPSQLKYYEYCSGRISVTLSARTPCCKAEIFTFYSILHQIMVPQGWCNSCPTTFCANLLYFVARQKLHHPVFYYSQLCRN